MSAIVPTYRVWVRGGAEPLRLKPRSAAQEQALLESLRSGGDKPDAWLHWGAAGGTAGGVRLADVMAYVADPPEGAA